MNKIVRLNSNHPDFQHLIKSLDAELHGNYGALQEHYNQFNNVEGIDTVVVGYVNNEPCGCGCFKPYDKDTVEIKRMFVKKDQRGQGLSGLILKELEKWAREKGYTRATLETGIKQIEAIGFYSKYGYQKISNFEQYIGNSNSLCFAKSL